MLWGAFSKCRSFYNSYMLRFAYRRGTTLHVNKPFFICRRISKPYELIRSVYCCSCYRLYSCGCNSSSVVFSWAPSWTGFPNVEVAIECAKVLSLSDIPQVLWHSSGFEFRVVPGCVFLEFTLYFLMIPEEFWWREGGSFLACIYDPNHLFCKTRVVNTPLDSPLTKPTLRQHEK
jgi:hypothetical protein